MMPFGMFGVWMGQLPAECPALAALGQHWQMLANLDAGCLGGDWVELSAHFTGRVRLHVKAVLLCQPAGEENIDDRLCMTGPWPVRHSPQWGKVIDTQP